MAQNQTSQNHSDPIFTPPSNAAQTGLYVREQEMSREEFEVLSVKADAWKASLDRQIEEYRRGQAEK